MLFNQILILIIGFMLHAFVGIFLYIKSVREMIVIE